MNSKKIIHAAAIGVTGGILITATAVKLSDMKARAKREARKKALLDLLWVETTVALRDFNNMLQTQIIDAKFYDIVTQEDL